MVTKQEVAETTPEPTSSGTEGNGRFHPEAHLKKIQGKEYLEVKWRLVWFRQDFPITTAWGVRTEAEEVTEQRARYRAQVVDPEGRIVAEGTKTETKAGFPDFVEKAETGAIGRALAICGYGTQFCGEELDEGERIVDSPVERPAQAPAAPAKPAAGMDLSPAQRIVAFCQDHQITAEQRKEIGQAAHLKGKPSELTQADAAAFEKEARKFLGEDVPAAGAPQPEEEPANV